MSDPRRQTGRTTRTMVEASQHGPHAYVVLATQREVHDWDRRFPGVRCITARELADGKLRGRRVSGIDVDHHVWDFPIPDRFYEELALARARASLGRVQA